MARKKKKTRKAGAKHAPRVRELPADPVLLASFFAYSFAKPGRLLKEQLVYASWRNLAAVCSVFLGVNILLSVFAQLLFFGGFVETLLQTLAAAFFVLAIALFAGAVMNLVVYAVARSVGGKGVFVQQAYLSSFGLFPYCVYSVPLFPGGLAELFLLYALVLFVMGAKKAHGFDVKESLLGVVLPALVSFVPLALLLSSFVTASL